MSNRIAVYYLFVGLLVACNLDEPPTPSVPALTLVPTNTAFIAAAPTATSIPNPMPSPTVLPTETVRVIRALTPPPSFTPHPSATPVPASFSFPTWVNDPQAAVLLAPLRSPTDRNQTAVSLLNAGTGERFDFWASEEYWHVKWLETGLAFLLYQALESGRDPDDFYLHQIDTSSGLVSQLPLSTLYTGVSLAPGGHFAADIVDQTVLIIDLQTGQEITLDDPFNGRYPDHVSINWSVDGTLLAVQRVDWNEVNSLFGLAIYTADGRLYRYYAGVDSWAWAADGSYRLLTVIGSVFNNGEPCVLDIQVDTTDCLSEVTTWRENDGTTGYYEWLPDGSGISFLYWNRGGRTTGLCIMDLASREITCPINETILAPANLGADVGGVTYLVDYQWSADGRYLVLDIDPSPPEGDDRTLTQVATIARDGSQFHVWGFGLSWNAEWRPQITTED